MLTTQDNKDRTGSAPRAHRGHEHAGQQREEDPELRPSDTRPGILRNASCCRYNRGVNCYIVDMNWQSWKEYEQITKVQRKLCEREWYGQSRQPYELATLRQKLSFLRPFMKSYTQAVWR